jgi:hypothetical protein
MVPRDYWGAKRASMPLGMVATTNPAPTDVLTKSRLFMVALRLGSMCGY